MHRVPLVMLLVIIISPSLFAQDDYGGPRSEIGFDLLPIIVTGSTNTSSAGLGVELFFARKMWEGKFRARYLLNRRGPNYHHRGLLSRYEKMLTANILRTVENRYWQRQNHGIRVGYERVFRTKAVEYYWGCDLFGQYNRAQIASLALVGDPGNPDVDPVEEFSAVNNFNSYELGLIPTLGLGLYIDEKIQLRIELGPKLSVAHQEIPLINADNELVYVSHTISSSELFLLNDILLTYKF